MLFSFHLPKARKIPDAQTSLQRSPSAVFQTVNGVLNLFSNLLRVGIFVKYDCVNRGNVMKKRIRMVDIADAAKVSRTTVSLVMNNIPGTRIAEATRQHVIRVARELGYAPGPLIEDIDPEQKRIFGVLMNELAAAYPTDLIDSLQTFADDHGFQVVIQVTGLNPDHETAALRNFSRLGAEGVIYATAFTTIVTPSPALDSHRHVFLNCRRKDGAGTSVLPAERHNGALATQHLIDRGCRRIATITGDPWQLACKERLAGYRRALNQAGLAHYPALECSTDWGHRQAHIATTEMLEQGAGPDGIVCQNDIIARGAIAAIRDFGLRVPDDIAVIGYDNREFTKDLHISTIILPHVAMAERAMTILTDDHPLKDGTQTIPGNLVTRDSTAKGEAVATEQEDGK
ncbi:hypothetical protein TM49_13985 [Martelella endophytica]|uniref:HTH lacI-type domain-containing protein n=2 Tax=Martelella endophytica TaxID=1486262 RepID=A0A0D5LT39_MAREN|nr:hypothetical protein TM49_13985 [Martelella endophytica]